MEQPASFPPPSIQAFSLIAALTNTENHDIHVAAIRSRDEAFSASPESYSQLCYELLLILIHADTLGAQILPSTSHPIHVAMTQLQGQQPHATTESQWLLYGQMAGFALKNALLRPPRNQQQQQMYSILPAAVDLVKRGLLQAIQAQRPALRNVATTLLATITTSTTTQPLLHRSHWPELMDTLLYQLQQKQQSSIGASLTLQKIMQDNTNTLTETDLNTAVPIWIQQATLVTITTSLRVAALDCLLHALPRLPAALVAHWSDYINALDACRPTQAVLVCKSIHTILQYRPEGLLVGGTNNNNSWMIPFVCTSTAQQDDDDLALEACDVWLTFATMETTTSSALPPALHEQLEALLPELIPVLLQKMVYTIDQRLAMEADLHMQDGNDGDKPVFHKSTSTQRGGGSTDDDDNDDGDDDMEWNVRKCAAASLDALGHTYGGDHLLPLLLPHIEQGLTQSQDPWTHEACLLALGAIAGGCMDAMDDSVLGSILPNCVALLRAPHQQQNETVIPPLLSIAAWTMGQYAHWLAERPDALQQAVDVLLIRARQVTKTTTVQIACLVALGSIIQVAGPAVTKAVPPGQSLYGMLIEILEANEHRKRVLLVVLDVVHTLAESRPDNGGNPAVYIPPLLKLWDHLASLDPSDTTLLPLMECLATLAPVLGKEAFQPFGRETFDLAMCMIETVGMFLLGQHDLNEEDVDPIVCATDVVDGLVLCFQDTFPSLLRSSNRYEPTFGNAVMQMLDHEVTAARGSAFALVGDLTRYAPQLLQPAAILQAAIPNMDPSDHHLTTTNAVWAVGELCVPLRGNPSIVEPFVPDLIQKLIVLLMGNAGPHERGFVGLSENAAVCMGRLALIKPSFCSADAPRFLLGWCDALGKVADPVERRDGFAGFVRTVYENPQAISQASSNITETVVSILFALLTWHLDENDVVSAGPGFWSRTDISFHPFPPDQGELFQGLSRLVRDLKEFAGDQNWHLIQKNLPVKVRQLFREVYKM